MRLPVQRGKHDRDEALRRCRAETLVRQARQQALPVNRGVVRKYILKLARVERRAERMLMRL